MMHLRNRSFIFVIAAGIGFVVGCRPVFHGEVGAQATDSAVPITEQGSRAEPVDSSEGGSRYPSRLNLPLSDDVLIELVFVPAGEFWMGSLLSEPGRDADERRDRVRIHRPFYMSIYEITQRQWEAVMGGNPSHFQGDAQLPVDSVSWDQAIALCRRLSEMSGRTVRLPTEAEWEYACRADSATAYAFGAQITPMDANYDWSQLPGVAEAYGGSPEKTLPVGSFAPNAWGLYDMHGNVNEWCQDGSGRYDRHRAPRSDSVAPSANLSHVLRGGSWYDHARRCRSAYRHGYKGGDRDECIGLRIVVTIP